MFPPRVYLKKIEPFSFLSKSELEDIIKGLESEIFGKDEVIFREDDMPLRYLYILKCGRVSLMDKKGHEEILKDGDMFGVASIISSNPPKYTAIAEENSVCYLIKKENFLKIFNSNKGFSDFFLKLITKRLSSLLTLSKVSRGYEHLYATPLIELVSRDPVVCSKDTKIIDIAKLMSKENVGSVVVIENNKVVGIFTQRDLARIVAYSVSVKDEVGKYMSYPVIEAGGDSTIMEAYLSMVSKGINHLVITDDGNIKGVISSRDILLKLESFSSLLSLSRRIISYEEKNMYEIMQNILKRIEDISSKINFSEVSRVASGMYDMIIEKIIKRYEKEFNVDFAWIQIGISGRKELVFPKIHSVVIYESTTAKKMNKFIKSIKDRLIDTGFDILYLKIINAENMERFVNSNNNFTDLYDSRFFYGNKELYEKFLDILAEREEEAVFLSAKKCITMDGYDSIINGIRALSLEFGICDIKNTEERCRLLEKHERSINDVLESYRVISDIDMRKKFYHKLERIDNMLLRESKKILLDFKRFIGRRYGIKG